MKRWLFAAAVFAVIAFLGWYAGIDLQQRGFLSAWLTGSALAFAFIAYAAYPMITEQA